MTFTSQAQALDFINPQWDETMLRQAEKMEMEKNHFVRLTAVSGGGILVKASAVTFTADTDKDETCKSLGIPRYTLIALSCGNAVRVLETFEQVHSRLDAAEF